MAEDTTATGAMTAQVWTSPLPQVQNGLITGVTTQSAGSGYTLPPLVSPTAGLTPP